jgi:hypothetical protein
MPILDPQWLAGFTDGEGCFYIKIQKSKTNKNGSTVSLSFLLTQHSRDDKLLVSLISYLGCGRFGFLNQT